MSHLLEIRNLHVEYPLSEGIVRAVNGVSFHLDEGKTLAIVGESASGKSTVAHAIMGVLPSPGQIVAGEVLFRSQDLVRLPERKLRQLRGNEICMVLQNPIGSFDPVYSVGKQIVEAIRAHKKVSRKAARDTAMTALSQVGIPHPSVRFHQYPHEFSGGMSQRALIAMALVGNPQLLIADEPTSALDVTVQAQIMELLRELQDSYGLTIILITHDLGLAAVMADDVAVMYAGRIVEYGTVERVFYQPQHPYTVALLKSVMHLNEERPERLQAIEGAPPNPLDLPVGCKFNPRCPHVMEVCHDSDPPLEEDAAGGRVACHLAVEERVWLGERERPYE